MAAPKLKTNDIIRDLRPSLEAGRLLISDFEKQTMLRQVRSIPARYQALALEGMIHFLDGKTRLGTEALDRSLELCPGDSVTWTNYSAVLAKKGLYTQLEVLMNRVISQSVTQMFEQALAFGAFWGDMDMMNRALEVIGKYGCDLSHDNGALDTFNEFSKLDESLREEIKNAASVVRSVAEEFGLACLRSHIESDGYDEMSFTCEVNIEDVDLLVNINSRVIDGMVAKGYETGRCVAYFESAGDI
ncbi:tetratricopeptide repeat protein [Citrobacter koseri]